MSFVRYLSAWVNLSDTGWLCSQNLKFRSQLPHRLALERKMESKPGVAPVSPAVFPGEWDKANVLLRLCQG